MKFKKIKILLPLIASVVGLSSCDFINSIFGKEEETNEEPTKTGYYKDLNFDLYGGRLGNALQTLNFEKHKNYVRYSQFNSYCSTTSDRPSIEGVPNTTKNEYFYTGKIATGTGTREHVWPCANSGSLWVHDDGAGTHYVDSSYYVGGGSDLFHVRTCNTTVNTARGNGKYVDFDDSDFDSIRDGVFAFTENNGKYPLYIQGYETTVSGGKQYADKCEPDDHMKGDVARIIMYVYIAYHDRGITPTGSYSYKVGTKSYTIKYSDMVGTLALTNVMGYDSIAKCAQTLVKWNKLDAPSEVEKQRNNTVQKIQGNRNPFVDFPELADQLFFDYIQ